MVLLRPPLVGVIALTNTIEQTEGLAAEEKLIRGCPKASAYVREFYDDPDVAHFKTIRLAVASGELPCLSYAQGKGLLSSRYVFRASDLVPWAKTRFYS